MTYQQIGFVLWDGATVRTGDPSTVKVYTAERMARQVGEQMGIPYRAVFIQEGDPLVLDKKTARHAAVLAGAPETPRGKISARGCRDRWNEAVRAMESPENGGLRVAMTKVLQILDDVIMAAEEKP